jgi:nucleoid DNA-binding protein
MVARARELENQIEMLDEQMGNANKELQGLVGGYQSPGALVTLLSELPVPVTDITLEDGTRVQVDEELKAPSMAATSKYRTIVVDWAKQAGHGGAVKSEVTVNVPVGKEALATEVLKKAEELGLQAKSFETINSQTLGALLRELLENGEDVPLDQLGAFMFKKANISMKKVK